MHSWVMGWKSRTTADPCIATHTPSPLLVILNTVLCESELTANCSCKCSKGHFRISDGKYFSHQFTSMQRLVRSRILTLFWAEHHKTLLTGSILVTGATTLPIVMLCGSFIFQMPPESIGKMEYEILESKLHYKKGDTCLAVINNDVSVCQRCKHTILHIPEL